MKSLIRQFAIESFRENSLQMAKVVIKTASAIGCSFNKIELLDKIKIGSVEFQRFNLDEDPTRLINALFSSGRSVIRPDNTINLKNGKSSKISSLIMSTAPRRREMFRGPGDPYWERQFIVSNQQLSV